MRGCKTRITLVTAKIDGQTAAVAVSLHNILLSPAERGRTYDTDSYYQITKGMSHVPISARDVTQTYFK